MIRAYRRIVTRWAMTVIGLLSLWHGAWLASGERAYLLPSPWQTFNALVDHVSLITHNAAITAAEIILGLIAGTVLGASMALLLLALPILQRWLLPLLVGSQAVPVFAVAPLLVLWFGYGLAPKIAMAAAMIFFPVASVLYDGLRNTEPAWLEVARVAGASPGWILWHVRLPAALPALASGLRTAAAIAPIAAILGEWVGATSGLGALMLRANAHVQTSLMFAGLLVLAGLALGFYHMVDGLSRRLIPWQRVDHVPTSP